MIKLQPKQEKTVKSAARRVALTGVLAATIVGGKFALAVLPNIEVVTLLCAVYGYVFGIIGIAAIIVFVICDIFIYGISTWVVSYFIYWPLVCVIFMLLRRLRVNNRIVFTVTAVILTIFFGALTSLIDVGLFMGMFDRLFYRFSVYYMRGIVFYIVHIVSNSVVFLTLFMPLKNLIMKQSFYKNYFIRKAH